MALVELAGSPIEGLKYNSDMVDQEGAALFPAQMTLTAPEGDNPEDVAPFAKFINSQASREDALTSMRALFVSGDFLSEEISAAQSELSAPIDLDALFDEIETEYLALPGLDNVDPALAKANADAMALIEVVERDGETVVLIDGDVFLSMPTKAAKATPLDKFVHFIQTILDLLALCFALLGIPVARGSQVAKKISDKFKKFKKYLDEATKAFGHFTKAYNLYKAAKDAGKSKKQAFDAASEAFAVAFAAVASLVVNRCFKLVKAVVFSFFDGGKQAIKTLAQLGLAIIEWFGLAAYKMTKAILVAIDCAVSVLMDIDKWIAMTAKKLMADSFAESGP